MIADTLEQTLNGGYNGLYAEVVTNDCYKMKDLWFKPDLVFDLGSNIGVYCRYMRELFPDTLIIAVEPDKDNFDNLDKFTPDKNIYKYWRAIGSGRVYRIKGAVNGAHESYITNGVGYPIEEEGEDVTNIDRVDMGTIMPYQLVDLYYREGMKSVMKIDIEGAENFIFVDQPSMDAIKKMDYIVMELHWAASKYDHDTMKRVIKPTLTALLELSHSHHCTFEQDYFYAIKK